MHLPHSNFIFYVYAYLRENGTPYYIGKGQKRRAFEKHKNVHTPERKRIILLETNLSELGALAIERRMIKWYGRKDNGSGILRNRTDGGEGTTGTPSHLKGKILPDSTKLKMQGRVTSSETKELISSRKTGVQLSDETREKMSIAKTGVARSPEVIEKMKKRRHPPEIIEKMRASARLRWKNSKQI